MKAHVTYGPIFDELLRAPRLAPLGPGRPNAAVGPRLKGLSAAEAFAPRAIEDADMAACCLAGIWLYHDHLDESHTISQGIETDTGSYWHGLMHRREPDYGNAKYWFRRVGEHPVFEPLHTVVGELAQASPTSASRSLETQAAWDPFAFIDLCEASALGRAPCEELCRRIQQREWELLFDFCYRRALGLPAESA